MNGWSFTGSCTGNNAFFKLCVAPRGQILCLRTLFIGYANDSHVHMCLTVA